jgi:hypothetical protein
MRRIGAGRRRRSEKTVVVIGVEYVHQLEIDVILGFTRLAGMNRIVVVISVFFCGIAPVAVDPSTIFDDTPIAKPDAADRADGPGIGTRMKFTFQGSNPLLIQDRHLPPPIPRPT